MPGGKMGVVCGFKDVDDDVREEQAIQQGVARGAQAEEENRRLAEAAAAASRIAELTASVASLLTNMPAMTFSKDAVTGRYVACNQAFAEAADKETPDGVLGLTDDEIFDPVTATISWRTTQRRSPWTCPTPSSRTFPTPRASCATCRRRSSSSWMRPGVTACWACAST